MRCLCTKFVSALFLLLWFTPPQVAGVLRAQERPTAAKSASTNAGKTSAKLLGDHYLMLVNTAIASNMDEAKLRQFDKSAYDGLAVAFLHAYDTSKPPTAASIEQRITAWKAFTSKDIWPWVYVNRMVGMSVAENNHYSDQPYFRKIAGADLDDKTGARADFLQLWQNSLLAARHSNVPGIVCDLEFYNYYKEYDIGELARQSGKTADQTAESLRQLGAKMADAAAESYPHATLWMLFTGLTHPGYKKYDGISYYPSPTYISIGLLDEIVKKGLPLKVLAGGEGSIGYCHDSLEQFRLSIQKRQSDLVADLAKYQGVMELGGTLALWSNRSAKTDWLNQGSCKASDADTIEDLQSYIELLLNTYRYNWLYGTSEGNYMPFAPNSAPRFDAVIAKARARTALNTKH